MLLISITASVTPAQAYTQSVEKGAILTGQTTESQAVVASPSPSIKKSAQDTESSVAIQDIITLGIVQLPTLDQPIIDQAHVLSISEQTQLLRQIEALYQQAQAQVGIIIVPTTGQQSIFDYSIRAADDWQLGSQKNDNGLLITVAVQDRKIQILTGYGLEGVLPDIVLNRMIREKITPYFQHAEYGQGLSRALTEIQHILDQDPVLATQAAQELQQRHETALHEQQNREYLVRAIGIILLLGILASFAVGNRLSAATTGIAGGVAGLVYGAGIFSSLLIGITLFLLLMTSIAQGIFRFLLSVIGRGGGPSGGSRGGGSSGYRGGGGFGGGGASGSW